MKAVTFVAPVFSECATAALDQTTSGPKRNLAGPVFGDFEKDSISFVRAERGRLPEVGCDGKPRFSSEAVQIGTATLDSERGCVGFLLLPREGGCADTAMGNAMRPWPARMGQRSREKVRTVDGR